MRIKLIRLIGNGFPTPSIIAGRRFGHEASLLLPFQTFAAMHLKAVEAADRRSAGDSPLRETEHRQGRH